MNKYVTTEDIIVPSAVLLMVKKCQSVKYSGHLVTCCKNS